jgi:hypothetical protein
MPENPLTRLQFLRACPSCATTKELDAVNLGDRLERPLGATHSPKPTKGVGCLVGALLYGALRRVTLASPVAPTAHWRGDCFRSCNTPFPPPVLLARPCSPAASGGAKNEAPVPKVRRGFSLPRSVGFGRRPFYTIQPIRRALSLARRQARARKSDSLTGVRSSSECEMFLARSWGEFSRLK